MKHIITHKETEMLRVSAERAINADTSMTMEPIATFHSPFGTKFGAPRQSCVVDNLRGEIHLHKSYGRKEALKGLDGFDFIWLIWGFSKNKSTTKSWRPTVRPPRLGGNGSVGVFASRSPFRPNPLGLSSVRIESVEYGDKTVIHVLGADLCDGTPIYDIKPYIPYTDSHPSARGGFTDTHIWAPLEVSIDEEAMLSLRSILTQDEIDALMQVLAQDPRPHYQDDPQRIYGMEYGALDVRFKVVENFLEVVSAIVKTDPPEQND